VNINRFYEFIKSHTTRCPEYHAKWHQENKKPEQERDFSWTKDYIRIQYVQDIDRDYISKYVAYVNHDAINERTNERLTQSQKESRLYPLKTFLRFCLRKGYHKDDLTRYIYVPSREKKVLSRILTVEEMERLLDAPNTDKDWGIRDRAILELAYSGLRVEELLNLKLSQVDVVTNTVTILEGKGGKDRVVPMTTEALYWMKRWLSRRQQFVKADSEYIFITKHGIKPIHKRAYLKFLVRITKKAGILLHVSAHDLRRTTATHLAERGAPIRQIQALLGHSTLKVTTKYLRLSEEKIKQEYWKSHPANRRSIHYA
jgi:integrase/recombinase XerD